MKIDRLELSAFGPFTDKVLDFSERPQALQLVYGPNEAGKSSTLRALTGLLYGIDPRTGDAHLHEMSKLRVGATLRDERGQTLSVVRRKGSKNTLLDPAGQPIGEGALAPLLGGLDEKLFRQMFGLDHVRLREGAEALLRGGGQLGEVLFDASSGGRSVHVAMEQLRAEADALYRARGRTPLLNVALDALKDRKKQRNDAMLSPQAFVEQQAALAAARAERDVLATERSALAAEKARLTRQLALLPLIAKHDQLSAELASMAGVDADQNAFEGAVRELEQRLASLRAGERGLPAERERSAVLEREMAQLRQRLGSSVAALHDLDSAARARLRKLVEAQRALVAEGAQLSRLEAAAIAEVARLEAALQALGAPPSLALVALVGELEREDLVGRMARGEAELEKLRSQFTRRLGQIGTIAAAQLASTSLPDDELLAKLQEALEHGVREAERLQRTSSEQASELARLTRAKDELLARGTLVSRAELEQVRRDRDRALDALLASGQQASDLRTHAALSERADVLADRMVDQAQRAAELAGVELAIARLEGEHAATTREREKVDAARAEASARWRALLEPWQLADRSARAARAAVTELVALRGLQLELQAQERAQAELGGRASERSRALMEATGDHEGHTLPEQMRRAKARLQREAERERERTRLEHALERQRAELGAHRAKAALVERERAALDARYRDELGVRGIDLELAPEELVACFDELAQLAQHTRETETLRARERAIHEERARLAADLGVLASQHLPAWTPAEDTLAPALEQLARLARERGQAVRDRARLAEELTKLDEQLAVAADGVSLTTVREELAGVERDVARARLTELDEQLEEMATRLKCLDESIGRLTGGLEHLEQVSGAAELAEQYEQDLAHARALTRRYLELRLALSLLGREVERFRSEHQAPVLKRAAALFSRLTLHRYKGLKVEYDTDDEPVLACLLGQSSVRMHALSDGTRDQLYLALRVASIERYCEGKPAVPLILDDVLIHFDDARAAAALEVLAELGRHTQVLFFTHHARMVELARVALAEQQLQVHELAPRAQPRSDGPLFDNPS